MSSEPIIELMLKSDRLVLLDAAGDIYSQMNFGRVIIVSRQCAHEVTLREVGDKPGAFSIVPKVRQIDASKIPEGSIVQGPFGTVETNIVYYNDMVSGELQKRIDSFSLTSSHGRTSIQLDENAVGTFKLQLLDNK